MAVKTVKARTKGSQHPLHPLYQGGSKSPASLAGAGWGEGERFSALTEEGRAESQAKRNEASQLLHPPCRRDMI